MGEWGQNLAAFNPISGSKGQDKNDPPPKFIPKIVLKKNDNEKEKVQRQISSGKNIFNAKFISDFCLIFKKCQEIL